MVIPTMMVYTLYSNTPEYIDLSWTIEPQKLIFTLNAEEVKQNVYSNGY